MVTPDRALAARQQAGRQRPALAWIKWRRVVVGWQQEQRRDAVAFAPHAPRNQQGADTFTGRVLGRIFGSFRHQGNLWPAPASCKQVCTGKMEDNDASQIPGAAEGGGGSTFSQARRNQGG